MSKEKWMYSIGENDVWISGQYDTKEEAIEECKKDYFLTINKDVTCYVGRVDLYCPFIDVDDVIERLQEDAYEHCGEASGDFLGATRDEVNELHDRLNKVFNEWLAEYDHQPTFGKMEDIEEIPMNHDCPICDKTFDVEVREDEQGIKHYYCDKCGHKFI